MATVIGTGGAMTVGTPAQVAGLTKTPSFTTTRRRRSGGSGGGRTTVAQLSEHLQTTKEGIVDIRTGEVIAPVGTSPSQAAQLSQKAFAAKQAAEKLEAQRIAKEQEQERQEKIAAGTIAGQISRGKPSQVELVPDEPRGFVQLGLPKAIVATGKRTIQRLTASPVERRPSFQDIIRPIDLTRKPVRAEAAFISPITGKPVSAEKLTSLQRRLLEKETGVKVTTFEDISKAAEKEAKGLIQLEQEKLQKQVTTGAKPFEEAQQEFIKRQEQIFKETVPEIKGISQERVSPLRAVIETGLAISPLTAFPTAATKLKEAPIKIDIEQVRRGRTIEAAITQRPDIETATFLGAGVIGSGAALSRTGRALEIANVEEALRQAQLAKRGFRIPTKEGRIVDITRGTGITEGAIANVEDIAVSELVDTTVITEGREQFIVLGRRAFSDRPFVIGGIREIQAKVPVSIKADKLTAGVGRIGLRERATFEATVTPKGLLKGEARLFPESQFEFQPFAGVSTRQKDIIRTVGGRISAAELETMEAIKFPEVTEIKGIRRIKDITISAPIESRAQLRVLRSQVEEEKGFSMFRGTGPKQPRPQVQTDLTQLPKITPRPISLPRPTTPKITQISQPSLVGIPRFVGGRGLTEQQLQQARGRLVPQETFETLRLPTSAREGLRLDFVPLTSLRTELLSDLNLGIRQDVRSRSMISQIGASIQQPIAIQERIGLREKTKIQTRSLGRSITQPKQILQQPILQIFKAPRTRVRFRPFDFVGFGLPRLSLPLLGGMGDRPRRPIGAKSRVRIAPSFTGIVAEIEEAAVISPTFGVLPGQIRGLETGLETIRKKKVKKKSKKKIKNK